MNGILKCAHRTLCLGGTTESALGEWRILLNYKFPRLVSCLSIVWKDTPGGFLLLETFDLCSPSMETASVLKPSWVVQANEGLYLAIRSISQR